MWDSFEIMLKALEKEQQDITNFIAEGQAPDYAAYKYKCGLLHGIEKAIAVLKDTKRKLDNAAFGDS